MKTIEDILEKLKKIKQIVTDFGYGNNIRLYHDSSQNTDSQQLLQLVVHSNSCTKTGFNTRSYLKAKLIELLDCQVSVTIYENVSPIYRDDIEQKSYSLDERQAIDKLVKQSNRKQIEYSDLTEEDRKFHSLILKQADDYLKKIRIRKQLIKQCHMNL